MSEWQPIETAPKDGEVILTHWKDHIVFAAWVDDEEETSKQVTTGIWPFRKTKTVKYGGEGGWRVMMLFRNFEYTIHGNYGPFGPKFWMPLPTPPAPGGAG